MLKRYKPRRLLPCPECGRPLHHGRGKRVRLFARHFLKGEEITSECLGSKRLWVEWTPRTAYTLSIDTHNRKLSLVIQETPANDEADDKFLVIALETAAVPGSIDEIFNDHQHKDLGFFTSVANAQQASESYCLEWLASPPAPQCHCTEIETAKL